MKGNKQVGSILKQAKQMRILIGEIPYQLQSYLCYQRQKIKKQNQFWFCGKSYSNQEISKSFKRAYSTFTLLEKAQFYLMSLKQAKMIKQQKESVFTTSSTKASRKIELDIKDEETQQWRQHQIEVQIDKKILNLLDFKQKIDLHNFLIRKSKNKEKLSLALQSTQTNKTIRIGCYSFDYEDKLNFIYFLWEEAQYDIIQQMLNKSIVDKQYFDENELDFGKQNKANKKIAQNNLNSLRKNPQKRDEQQYDSKDFQNQELSQLQDQMFVTVNGDFNNENNEMVIELDDQEENNSDQRQQQLEEIKIVVHPPHSKKHPMQPLPKSYPEYLTSEQGHCLWGTEWKIDKNGDFININKKKIQTQSGALKLIIKRMSKNLFSGKSILNTSLPIQIFGTDSNMERICKGYIYAPLILEKTVLEDNPVNRMKNCICFGLTFSISYIEMQKPFNPILGETFQSLIDGCPVYGEQISHHPPITSTYMVGRGFKIHGNFQAKIDLGLNSASGINEGFNHIEFYDGKSSMKFNTPPGQMSGLIYGDRKLSLIKKSYYIDQINYLFCEITWGKNKKSKFSQGKLNDYFEGSICKLKPSTNLQNYSKIKKSDIDTVYGEIHGRFTGKVFFQDQQLFDVQSAKPFKMIDYENCLQSDRKFREDIKERKKNNFDKAQDEKQKLEQIQRRDRKLRAMHHGN